MKSMKNMQNINKAEDLLLQLEDKIKEVSDIEDYNIYVSCSNSINAGFINKQIGGIYRPISVDDSIGGFYQFSS